MKVSLAEKDSESINIKEKHVLESEKIKACFNLIKEKNCPEGRVLCATLNWSGGKFVVDGSLIHSYSIIFSHIQSYSVIFSHIQSY